MARGRRAERRPNSNEPGLAQGECKEQVGHQGSVGSKGWGPWSRPQPRAGGRGGGEEKAHIPGWQRRPSQSPCAGAPGVSPGRTRYRAEYKWRHLRPWNKTFHEFTCVSPQDKTGIPRRSVTLRPRLCLALRGHLVSGDWMALSPCKDARPHFTPVSAQIPATETLVTAFLQPDCLTAKSLCPVALPVCPRIVSTHDCLSASPRKDSDPCCHLDTVLSEMRRSRQGKSRMVPFPEVPGASSSWRREAEGWVPAQGWGRGTGASFAGREALWRLGAQLCSCP